MNKLFLIILIIGIGVFSQTAPCFAAFGISYTFDYNGNLTANDESKLETPKDYATETGFSLGVEYSRTIDNFEFGMGIEWQKLREIHFWENIYKFGFTSGYGLLKIYLRDSEMISYNFYLLGRIGYGILDSTQDSNASGGFYYATGLGAKGDFSIFNYIELIYSNNQGLMVLDYKLQQICYNKMSMVIGMIL